MEKLLLMGAMDGDYWPVPAVHAMKPIRDRPTATCDPLPTMEMERRAADSGLSHCNMVVPCGERLEIVPNRSCYRLLVIASRIEQGFASIRLSHCDFRHCELQMRPSHVAVCDPRSAGASSQLSMPRVCSSPSRYMARPPNCRFRMDSSRNSIVRRYSPPGMPKLGKVLA